MDNSSSQSGDSNTGTRDVTYDLTAVLYHALQGAENCQIYAGDAQGKQEHRQFFEMALESQKRIAEQAKQLLHDCLMQETGGQQSMGQGGGMSQSGMSGSGEDGSAFRFASSETEGGSDQFSGGQSGSDMDREGGSALRSGEHTGAMQNDPGSGQFGQDPLGQGQRHNEMTTGGGGTSSF